jgi:hypothetical protein
MKKLRRSYVVFPLSPKAKAVRKRVAKTLSRPVTPTVRERAAQGISSDGRSPSRRDMSPAHTLELLNRYPNLYRLANTSSVQPCEPFAFSGFAVSDGWFSIIHRLSAKLAVNPNLVAVQVKEKWPLNRICG